MSSDRKWVKVKDGYYITKLKFVTGGGEDGLEYLVGQMKIVEPSSPDVAMELVLTPYAVHREVWKQMVKGK